MMTEETVLTIQLGLYISETQFSREGHLKLLKSEQEKKGQVHELGFKQRCR